MGRLIDSLSFNLPQQQVITSDPSKAPGAEFTQTYLAKGQQQSKRIEQFRGLVGSVAETGMKYLGTQIKKEQEEKTRAGTVYGLKAAQELNLSGDYNQVSQQIRDNFTVLRRNGEISLIDDPFFQAGLDKAQGITAIRQYDQAAAALYEKLTSAPDIYQNPDKFETEWRRLFDSFYITLPESTIYQEGFLSKVGPIQDKYLQAYKAASNEFQRKKFVQKQQESILASEFVYQETLRGFDTLSDTDILEQYTNFANTLVEGFATGEITPEEVKDYIGVDVTHEQDLIYQLQKTLDSNDPGQAMRSKLKAFAKVDLIKEVNEVYDEFYSFAGEGRGAIGVDPSELVITTLTKSFQDPGLAMEVLNSLTSGTGMLRDTEKGRAGLAILRENHERYATQQRQKELSQYRTNVQAFGRRAAIELAELEAKISTFGDILAIQAQKGEAISPTELYQILLTEAETLYTNPETGELYDEEGFANVVGNLKVALNRATSISNSEQRKLQVEGVFNEVMGITDSASDIEEKTVGSVALDLVQMNNSEPTLTSDLLQSRTGTLHNLYLTNPNDEKADAAFWNHVRVLKNFNAMNAGSSDVRVSPSYSSKDLLIENPGLIRNMIMADANYDALDVFVSPSTEIYDAIQAIGQPFLELGGDPAQLGVALERQLGKFEEDRQKKAEKQAELAREAEIKDRLGFSLDSIPLPGETGVVRGGVRDLLKNLDGIGSVNQNQYPTEVLGFFADAYGQEYKKLTSPGAEGGYSSKEAANIALKRFTKRFKVERVSDDIRMIVDSEQKMGDVAVPQYWESLEPDEDARQNSISGFVDDLRFMTNNKSSQTAIAWLSDFQRRTKKKLEEAAMSGFDQEYDRTYVGTRPNLERSEINSFYNDLRTSEMDPALVKVVGDTVDGYFSTGFSQTMELEGLSTFAPMSEGMLNGLAQRVLTSVEANSDYVGYKPTTITEARELLFNMDKNDRLGLQVFNPRYKEARKKERRDALRAELDGEGVLKSLLTRQFGPEVARIYTQQDAYIANTAIFDLDDTNFDWDTEEYMLLPTGDGRFYIKDKEGDTLRYKATGALYTFTAEDLGDRMIDGGLFNYAEVWKDVRDSIDPTIPISEMTTRDDFMDVVGPYFAEWPRDLGLPYFNNKFGDRAYPMYKIYREVKGMRTFRQEDQPMSTGAQLRMLLKATRESFF